MTDGLFARTHARGPVAEQASSRAWLRAMLDAEAALARTCASAGLIPEPAAVAISAACADPSGYDDDQLGRLAEPTGNPVVGLVAAIRERVGAEHAPHVHLGATSQDIIDTAAMLVARRCISVVLTDLDGCAQAAATLAREHRDTEMTGRTLLQQAVPITFGLKAAQWLRGLRAVRARLVEVQKRLPAQLGGAAGTLEGYGDQAAIVAVGFPTEVGLATAQFPWHTLRYPIGDLAGVLATTAGILGKIALDLVLLTQSEVAEIGDAVADRGGSSTMGHKHNPVAAIAARSTAKQAPGLAATLFAAMEHEHERAAGAWHTEWPTLSALLVATGSTTSWLREALETTRPDPDRMQRTAADLHSAVGTGQAGGLVDRALAAHDRDHPPRRGPS